MGSPLAFVFRWLSAATAVAGSLHAVSGATSLQSASSITGQVGAEVSYDAVIYSTKYGFPRSYKAEGVSPTPKSLATIGVSMTTAGHLGGAPTKTGTFRIKITGYDKANLSGDSANYTITLTVADAPPLTIVSNPTGTTVVEGAPASLTVGVTPPEGVSYQWIKDSIEIAGATSPTLSWAAIALADAGSYTVRVTRGSQSKLSTPAQLVVQPRVRPPEVSTPASQEVLEGDVAAFFVAVTSTAAFTYQWRFNGAEIPGERGATLTLTGVRLDQAGNYDVVVANSAGATLSPAARLTVIPRPIEAPVLTAPHWTGSALAFSFDAVAGHHYAVEHATDPAGPWSSQQTVNPGTSGGPVTIEVAPPTPDSPRAFLRLRVLP